MKHWKTKNDDHAVHISYLGQRANLCGADFEGAILREDVRSFCPACVFAFEEETHNAIESWKNGAAADLLEIDALERRMHQIAALTIPPTRGGAA